MSENKETGPNFIERRRQAEKEKTRNFIEERRLWKSDLQKPLMRTLFPVGLSAVAISIAVFFGAPHIKDFMQALTDGNFFSSEEGKEMEARRVKTLDLDAAKILAEEEAARQKALENIPPDPALLELEESKAKLAAVQAELESIESQKADDEPELVIKPLEDYVPAPTGSTK